MNDRGFHPFIAPSKLTPDNVRDLYSNLTAYADRRAAFLAEPTRAGASSLLQSQLELAKQFEALTEQALTLPVMVHIAGDSFWEDDPEANDRQRLVQPCARCGSPLIVFNPGRQMKLTLAGPALVEPEDVEWYPMGGRVAKVASGGAEGTWYMEEQERPLESWEHECIGNDLPVLGEDSNG